MALAKALRVGIEGILQVVDGYPVGGGGRRLRDKQGTRDRDEHDSFDDGGNVG